MAEKTTIARPYAKAAFEVARTENALQAWSDVLQTSARAVKDPRVAALLGNPLAASAEVAQFVLDLSSSPHGEHQRNFFHMLADNRRLGYLAEISTLFDQLKDDAEGVVDVTVISAAPMDSAQQGALAAALRRKLNRAVRPHFSTDASLIGGAVIRAGDLVIDGSMLARLNGIALELTA